MSQQHILQAQRLLAQARYKNNGHINQGRGLLKTMAWVGPMAPWPHGRVASLHCSTSWLDPHKNYV